MTILGLSIWRRRDAGHASAGDLVPDLTVGVAPSLGGGMLTGTLRL